MNLTLLSLEIAVVLLGLGVLLADLWLPMRLKRFLGYGAAGGLVFVLAGSFGFSDGTSQAAFGDMFVVDDLALFFKRFFLVAAILVLVLSVDFADRIQAGIAEFYALILFALTGMLLCASARDFVLMFVGLELITVSFYVLNSFQRGRVLSLEAGVKYLILGALSTAFMVYGIALIFGASNSTLFADIQAAYGQLKHPEVFRLGLLLVMAGLGFKIAAFPFQIWAPDVYQGSPIPATAFLAVGSKAAGFVLLLRVLFSAAPQVAVEWTKLIMVIAGVTILYGNLCAIPQRNLKRLLGYSSVAQAGYLLLGVAAMSSEGSSAILYYLGGYLFTVLAAFFVIGVVFREVEGEDISAVAGLHRRSPLLAHTLALAMISLAGIPPLAGFFGKFLLLKSVVQPGALGGGYWVLIAVALIGVVISFYYYLGVVQAIYWGKGPEAPANKITWPVRASLYGCIAGIFYLGVFPNNLLNWANRSVQSLKISASRTAGERPPAGAAAIEGLASARAGENR